MTPMSDADIGIKQFLSAQSVVFSAPAWECTTLVRMHARILVHENGGMIIVCVESGVVASLQLAPN